MNCQIINVPAPNSVYYTCVFSCFEATDTDVNLHCALDRFKTQVQQQQGILLKMHLLERTRVGSKIGGWQARALRFFGARGYCPANLKLIYNQAKIISCFNNLIYL